ncbi:MAG: hypothetical protein ABFQ65_01765 [Nanoarchaeota archaeon]
MKKKAAMEMSVGTIVTIVLLMTVLILGLVLVRNIFGSATENIGSIDTAVRNEINKLFSEDSTKKIVIYPPTREISIKKGDEGGFGFSIKNVEAQDINFGYDIKFIEKDSNCVMTDTEISKLVSLGKSGQGIKIKSLSSMENPILVKFSIPDSASLCTIRYGIDSDYLDSTVTVDLQIK